MERILTKEFREDICNVISKHTTLSPMDVNTILERNQSIDDILIAYTKACRNGTSFEYEADILIAERKIF